MYVTLIAQMPDYDEQVLPWFFFAVAFGLSEVGVVHFSVRGHAVSVSLAEIPLVIGFYFASPATLVLSQLAGAAVALAIVRRQPPIKLVFNLALFSLTSSIAIAIFRTLAPPTLDDILVWWFASFAGTTSVVVISAPAIALAISLSARRFEPSALIGGLGFGILAGAVNTSLALMAVVFLRINPQDLWLVLLPAVVVGLGYRAYASQQERQARIEFLYDCARILQGSFLDADTLTALLTRTRAMLHAEVAEIVISPTGGRPYPLRAFTRAGGQSQAAERSDGQTLADRLALLGPDARGALLRRPFRDSATARLAAAAGLTDAVVVPLQGDADVVGTLLVGNREGYRRPFSADDLRVVETLGVHAGVALQNSSLVDRLAESLASVTQLAIAVEASDDAIVAVAADGAITAWNPAAERVFGLSGAELAGVPISSFVPPGLSEDVTRAFGGMTAGAARRRGTTELLRPGGARIPVSVTVSPIRGATDALAGISVIVHDESERIEADAALRESDERFRRVFQDSPIGMALEDADQRWTAVNDVLCRILARPEEELVGRRFDTYVHPDDVEGACQLMDEMLGQEASRGFSTERRYLSGDGRTIWARVTSRPLRDDQRGGNRLVCMIEDITESRNAADRLRDTEARLHRAVVAFTAVREPASVLRAVLTAARDLLDAEFAAIGVLTDDGMTIAEFHFDGIDEPAASAIGLVPTGSTILGLATIESGPARLRDVREHPQAVGFPSGHPVITSFVAVPIVFEGRLVARLYAGNKRSGLEFDGEDEGVATALAAQAAVVLENARINARTQALVEELDQANSELRKANDAKSEFLGTVSHELRTPLHSILVAAELVHDPIFGPLSETRARELGATIQGSGRHLLGLIDDLVDLSRIEADRIELRLVDLAVLGLLNEIRHELAPLAAERGVELGVRCDADVRIHADPLRIRQVLINLLANAIKFTGRGGRVWAEASAGATTTRIAIHDTGLGISEEDQARIFEPFEQVGGPGAHGSGGHGTGARGAGLGLAIARRLVELHGGLLDVASVVGEGSTFTIHLPENAPAQRPPADSLRAVGPDLPASRRRSTILVVEDDVTALGLVSDLLRRSGYAVWQAGDIAEAQERLRAGTPSLVLLDIRLGADDGLDLARRLRSDPATRTLPILALSADAMQHDRERAAEAGCDAHLAKPVVARDLLGSISRLLEAAEAGPSAGGLPAEGRLGA
ncbi:MAG: PAS domain S-box protein [Chloroflexota bacterium]